MGVINKIEGTVSRLADRGFAAKATIIGEPGLGGELQFVRALVASHDRTLILRCRPFWMLLYLPLLCINRMRGQRIIIDVPTPLCAVCHEVTDGSDHTVIKALKFILLCISNPIGLTPAHRILHYAPESKYFSTWLNAKTCFTANGIDVKAVPRRNAVPQLNDEFVIVGIGKLAYWHGFDRIIKAISRHNATKAPSVRFIVVGDGEIQGHLEELARELGVSRSVSFQGYKVDAELNEIFDQCHLGVCSLGLFRKHLDQASQLKAREYASRGIPFILSGADPDFPTVCNFVYRVANDSSPIDLGDIIAWYRTLNMDQHKASNIRKYAESHLDYSDKLHRCLL